MTSVKATCWFWDANGNSKYDAGMEIDTMLDISDGTAETDFSLDEVGSGTIIYVPNGKDPLRSGRIATVSASSTACRPTATPRPKVASANLNYAGAEDALLAYAIAPPSNPTTATSACAATSRRLAGLFACDGADGMVTSGRWTT